MNDESNFNNDITHCITHLREELLILYPTDTVWGIGCDAQSEVAINKIIDLKNRPGSKSFIILVASFNDISNFAKPPSLAMLDFANKSEKPVTFILKDAKNLASQLISEDGTVAIRVPDDPFCTELLLKFGKPIVSTSANISGEFTPGLFKEISKPILKGVDYIVQFDQTNNVEKSGSRIITEDADGIIKVIRD